MWLTFVDLQELVEAEAMETVQLGSHSNISLSSVSNNISSFSLIEKVYHLLNFLHSMEIGGACLYGVSEWGWLQYRTLLCWKTLYFASRTWISHKQTEVITVFSLCNLSLVLPPPHGYCPVLSSAELPQVTTPKYGCSSATSDFPWGLLMTAPTEGKAYGPFSARVPGSYQVLHKGLNSTISFSKSLTPFLPLFSFCWGQLVFLSLSTCCLYSIPTFSPSFTYTPLLDDFCWISDLEASMAAHWGRARLHGQVPLGLSDLLWFILHSSPSQAHPFVHHNFLNTSPLHLSTSWLFLHCFPHLKCLFLVPFLPTSLSLQLLRSNLKCCLFHEAFSDSGLKLHSYPNLSCGPLHIKYPIF